VLSGVWLIRVKQDSSDTEDTTDTSEDDDDGYDDDMDMCEED
jgi:hypothetical protein